MNDAETAEDQVAPSKQNGPHKNERHYATQLLTFQVENQLFRIADNLLRGSPYFGDMLDADHIGKPGEGGSDENPIVLRGISAKELEGFLDVCLPRLAIATAPLTFDQLSAALHLATMWSFDHIREYVIHQIDHRFADPVDRIELSLK